MSWIDAPVVRAHRALEQDRPRAADTERGAREQPRVVAVEAQAARVRVDVAERVGQQVEVAVLEDLDAAEVGGLLDRDDARLDERATADSAGIGGGRAVGSAARRGAVVGVAAAWSSRGCASSALAIVTSGDRRRGDRPGRP